MQKKLIDLSGVSKHYTSGQWDVRALDSVTLRIAAREFVAVTGDSGSGKSTLMNMLGCLDMPTQGSYLLDGQPVSKLSDDALSAIRNQKIGFIFQGFNLIPTLSALENVELPLMYRGVAREKRRRMAMECLEKVGLSARIRHRPAQLSGGQQQRVAIARAIAGSPPILLADEPTGNLDSKSGMDVLDLLKNLWREGNTIILITHDQKIAAGAQRVIRVHDGRIVEDRENGGEGN